MNITVCMLLSKRLQWELEGLMLTSLCSNVILCFIALCWNLDQNVLFHLHGCDLPLKPQEEGHRYGTTLSKSTA